MKFLINHKPYLIYFVVGINRDVLNMLELCIKSLRETNNCEYIDIFIMCDNEFLPYVQTIFGDSVKYHITGKNTVADRTSMRKTEVFNIENIHSYEKVLYLDCDMLVCGDIIKDVFSKDLADDMLYVVEEVYQNPHRTIYFSFNTYTEDEIRDLEARGKGGFNCGQFLFVPSTKMKQDFDNILQMITNHTGNFYYEQSFMNVYFNKKGNTSTSILQNIVQLKPSFPTDILKGKSIVHFNIDPPTKYTRMVEYHAMFQNSKARIMSDDEIVAFVKPYTMTSEQRIRNAMFCVETVIKQKIPGDLVEIGVWKGGIIMAMALKCIQLGDNRLIHVYDTFEGMTTPSANDIDHTNQKACDILQSVLCKSEFENTKKNIELTNYTNIEYHKGDILQTPIDTIPKKIAVLRLDTDWYELTKFELEHFEPYVSNNGFIIIDDYGHWKGCKKAVDEFFNWRPCAFNYIDYTGIWWAKLEEPIRKYDTRVQMIQDLKLTGDIAEIGVLQGEFAEQILATCPDITSLTLVDAWDLLGPSCGSGDVNGNNGKDYSTVNLEQSVRSKFEKISKVTVIKSLSSDYLSKIADNSLDAVYIDADHSYHATLNDLRNAFHKVKQGGWILGHDYGLYTAKANEKHMFGVAQAVHTFLSENSIELRAIALDGCVSFAIQK